MQTIKLQQQNINERIILSKQRSVLSRILPIILFVSFIWLNFYDTTTEINNFALSFGSIESVPVVFGISIILYSFMDYIIFELFFFIYRFFMGFSIYSFMIPKYVLIDKFRIWYIIRNVLLGILFNLRFFFPYIITYLSIIEMICNFALIICLYYDLQKQYIEPLVGQFVFKTLALPVVLYEVYQVIRLVVSAL